MHLPTFVVQLLFCAQLPVCLYGGCRIARRTGRSALIWLVLGFLAAIAYPPFGAVIIFVLFLVVPPVRSPGPRVSNEGPGAGSDGGADQPGRDDAPLEGAAR